MTDPSKSKTRKEPGSLKRILFASDLTAYTDRAFDRAVMLAEEHHASLRLLHAVDPDILPESYVQRDIGEAKQSLEHEVCESGIDKRLEVSVQVTRGDAAKVIVNEAEAMRANLIIMGLSHDMALTSMIRGTTIDKVVRSAGCPILVVKKRPWRPYEKIAVAVDLAPPSRRALDVALHAMPKGQLTIIHVNESIPGDRGAETAGSPAEMARHHQISDLVTARFAAAGRDALGSASGPNLIVESGKASTALQRHVARLAPDLVVLGTHGRTGIPKLFLGSVAETLLEVLSQDVLVVRA
ncbi:MAG: universal stress protein [Alphaproteobacteria bacterium]